MHKLTLTLLVATYLQYLNITKSLLATIDITISKKTNLKTMFKHCCVSFTFQIWEF